ncbi:M28 family peptidase [Variovorax paradoxus]|uniref:M28 family peptidase n=1 Tax=Variovorax paradoxus TaxID=34073 RepID=UPI003D6593DE
MPSGKLWASGGGHYRSAPRNAARRTRRPDLGNDGRVQPRALLSRLDEYDRLGHTLMKISTPWTCSLVLVALSAGCTWAVTQPFAGAGDTTPPAVEINRLEKHVRHLSVDLHPRRHNHPQNLDRAADSILKEFTAAGAKTRTDEYMVQGQKYRNVIASFGSSSGPLRIIGAHYDSHSHGGTDTSTPGADDNASGIAGLLELAHRWVDLRKAAPLSWWHTPWKSRPTFAPSRWAVFGMHAN